MRTQEELKERIRMALVEDMNNIQEIMKEPENQIPPFLEKLTNHIFEIVLDEITFKRKY